MEAAERDPLLPERLDSLVLARLATVATPPSATEVARAIRAAAPPELDDARWTAAIARAIERLQAAGRVDGDGRVPGGAAAAAAAFGVTSLDWKRAWDRIAPGLALGVTADDAKAQARLATRDAWVAAIVGRARGLWTAGPPPSLSAMGDALVWQLAGLTGKPGRVPKPLRAHFVSQALGAGSGPFERRAALLAAREAGAARADLPSLRAALVQRWLRGRTWTGPPAAEPPPVPDTPSAPSADADLAAAVRAAAGRVAADGRFGARKVFVAALARDPAFRDLPLTDFKRRLLSAHQAGALALARADLAGAMDPALVRDSEIAHLDSRYHFVELEAP